MRPPLEVARVGHELHSGPRGRERPAPASLSQLEARFVASRQFPLEHLGGPWIGAKAYGVELDGI
jgi:hypothetical protein